MSDLVLWMTVGVGVVTTLCQLGSTARLAPWQALSPWLMAPSAPAGLFALATGRWWTAIAAGAVLVALALLGPPLRRRSRRVDGPVVRVLYANVKFDQPTPELAAQAVLAHVTAYDVDLLAASEVTIAFARALEDGGIVGLLPHRVGEPVVGPEASVIWSRRPVIAVGETGPGPTWDADATIEVDGAPVRIIATHPLPPVGADMRPHWLPGLASTAERARRTGPPVLVVGDLNASRWHPAWRRFAGRDLTSVHEAMGRGWTTSWPADRWFAPFVRLDHALHSQGLCPVDLAEVTIPGSDHRGFVVTMASVDASERTARPR